MTGKRAKVSQEALDKYAADAAVAQRFDDLLARARSAEQEYREAQAAGAAGDRLYELSKRLDAALTDAMRAAFAAQRVQTGPRGYDDRIFRRKAMATPQVRVWTMEAQRLLTMRESHRLTGVLRLPHPAAVSGAQPAGGLHRLVPDPQRSNGNPAPPAGPVTSRSKASTPTIGSEGSVLG